MLDLLDVRKLRVLREVSARGTIAAAAEALGMTPSAASQQLSSLERESGVELVVRSGRSVRLTPAAIRLVDHTERILEQLEAARHDLSTDPAEISGELHVSAFSTAIRHVVAPALPALREQYPELDVAIVERDTEAALAALSTGTIDLAVIYDYDLLPSPAPAGASLELLLEEPLFLIVPDELPLDESTIDLSLLAHERWIGPSCGTSCNTFVRRVCNQAGFEPQFWGVSDDFDAMKELVAMGCGIALVPSLGARWLPPGTRRIRLGEPAARRRIHVATRAGNREHPAVCAIVDELRRAARLAEADVELAATPVR